jgi:xanthine/CO dehydrogenase XdhC/CoxF family maturation factor
MEDQDRQSRLETASALLTLLKLHGGSARLAAAWLEVSPTTITNWHLIKEATTRKQGAPSDIHLRKLTALAAWQVRQAIGCTRSFILSELMRNHEAIVLTRSLAQDYRAMADALESKAAFFEKSIEDLRAMTQKHGPSFLDFLAQPFEAHYGPEMPDSATMQPSPHIDPDAFFRGLEVSQEDIKAQEDALQKFFAARNAKYISGEVARVRKERSGRTKK